MKCVCGYERLQSWQGPTDKEIGEDDFILLETAVIKREKEYSCGYDDKEEVYLYACPKCGTVKIEL